MENFKYSDNAGRDEYRKKFAENLRRLMSEKNKSQTDIANELRVSQPTVSTWITGKKIPRYETLDKLCAYLNCNRSDLIEEFDVPLSEKVREELVVLAMKSSLENVNVALIVLKALEQKKTGDNNEKE